MLNFKNKSDGFPAMWYMSVDVSYVNKIIA